jgi:hypothetical protein
MARRRTLKIKKSLRRNRGKSRRERRNKRGGGYSDGPDFVNPGNLVHNQYSGPGKDCTGNPQSIRPGYISNYDPKGLPGLSGGMRGKKRKSRGGSNFPVTNPNLPPVSGSLTPKPGDFPNTTGAAGTVANPQNLPVVMSMPGVPPPGMAQMPIAQLSKAADASNLNIPQKGGRYGFFPQNGPLNPVNGVGVSPAPFGRIPCETGTYNPLNPDPNGIQTMSTAPLRPPFMSGGSNFPTVQVGDADSMRYYAPTAGYRNDFMTFRAPSPVPGLTIQTPYDARAFNQACIKTGGGPVAFDAGKFTPVTMNEIGTRKDFDGSDKGLPVKFGGKRRSRRVLKNKRKSRKGRK